MKLHTGIEPLDGRLGGLTPGGAYVIAGVPGSGRLLAVLQFLAAGLSAGARVALIGATAPERVMEHGRHWGLELEQPWKDGRLRLLSFKPDFERRLLSAAEPGEVFAELGQLLGAGEGLERLGIHPGAPLWETRSGTSLASQFVRWAESLGSTTWATVASDLEDTLSPATDWVLQAASGLFYLERLPTGLHQLWIRRLSPPTMESGPITLEAAPGRGLVAPTGQLDRRRTDPAAGSEGRLAILCLAPAFPPELAAWAGVRHREVVELEAPLELVERLQGGEAFELILVYPDRGRIEEAVQACRVLRGLSPAPILVATEDRVRSTDRVRALEAGAADVLSAPLSVAELASRAERAREAAATGAPARRLSPPGGAAEGVLDGPSFAVAVRQRLARPEWSVFILVRFRAAPEVAGRVQEVLLSQVRGEAGDLVGRLEGGLGVVLQGAQEDQAAGFLGRVRRALGEGGGVEGGGGAVGADTWSGLRDRERIEALLAEGEAGSPSGAS